MKDYEGGKGEGKDTTIFELPAVLAHIGSSKDLRRGRVKDCYLIVLCQRGHSDIYSRFFNL